MTEDFSTLIMNANAVLSALFAIYAIALLIAAWWFWRGGR